MKLKSPFLVKPGDKVRLHKLDTSRHPGIHHKEDAEAKLGRQRAKLDKLQELLYASESDALLVVLQGMDTAGKDGTIRSIFDGVNPQGCQVASFKVPTSLELRHDFLWRCHAQVPPLGMIGLFNRSHYEQVLSPRVHGKISRKEALKLLGQINDWEAMLAEARVTILKFFLHISHEEQTKRLQARLDDPSKHWKLSPSDFAERHFWPDYMEAYEDVLSESSTKHAPWFVIPADHKYVRNVAISELLVDALEGMKLQYPKASFDPSGIHLSKDAGKDDVIDNPAVAAAAASVKGRAKAAPASKQAASQPEGSAKPGHKKDRSQPAVGQQTAEPASS